MGDRRKAGDLGESTFVKLCDEVGILAHKTQRDYNGWDFYVELPYNSQQGKEYQLVLPEEIVEPISAHVQVKATDGYRPRFSIPLKHCERFSQLPLPCFFVVLGFGGGPDPEFVHCVHFGHRWIERTLRHKRELASQLAVERRRKPTLQLRPTMKDLLCESTGEALLQAMRETVPHGMQTYLKAKHECAQTCGYTSSSSMILRFKTKSDDSYALNEEWADVAIGEQDALEVFDTELEDHRFGVPVQIDTASRGWVSLPEPPARDCTVTVRNRQGVPVFVCDASVRHSHGVFPFLRSDVARMAVDLPYGRFVIRLAQGRTTFKWSLDAIKGRQSLRFWLNWAEWLDAFRIPGNTVELTTPIEGAHMPLLSMSTPDAPELDEFAASDVGRALIGLKKIEAHLRPYFFWTVSGRSLAAQASEYALVSQLVDEPHNTDDRIRISVADWDVRPDVPIMSNSGYWATVLVQYIGHGDWGFVIGLIFRGPVVDVNPVPDHELSPTETQLAICEALTAKQATNASAEEYRQRLEEKCMERGDLLISTGP